MELNKIYTGDCLEILKTLPNNSVDCVITDPPYNISVIGRKYIGIEINPEYVEIAKRRLSSIPEPMF